MAEGRLISLSDFKPKDIARRVGEFMPAVTAKEDRSRPFPWIRFLFILIVVIPTASMFFYAVTFAKPFFASESQFALHNKKQQSAFAGIGGMMASLGMGGGGDNDVFAVKRFLQSADVLRDLESSVGFRWRYASPNGDFVTRLSKTANDDDALGYFRKIVTVRLSTTENIITLNAWGYTPEDAREVSRKLLNIIESFVNRLNQREQGDGIRFREMELKKTEDRLLAARLAMSTWRNANGSIDPKAQADMINGLIGGLEQELARVRADLLEMTTDKLAERFQPRIAVLRGREASLTQRIAEERKRIGGMGTSTLTTQINEFEKLSAEFDFATKAHDMALASLESARQEASQQQKYIVTISEPSLPIERVFPLVGFHTGVVFLTSLLIYGIAVLLYTILRDYRSV